MKTNKFWTFFIFLLFSTNVSAQTTLDISVGMDKEKPTYRLGEFSQTWGRWIIPDVGYLDFGEPQRYREWFAGFGYKIFASEKFELVEEVFFVQAEGSEANKARYIQPFMGAYYTPHPRINLEVSGFVYIPLNNKEGQHEWVLEKAKIEFSVSLLSLGVGYGANSEEGEWVNKPFLTATLAPASGKFGSLEVWYFKPREKRAQIQAHLSFSVGK
jgi:hypothetical protein